MEHLKFAGRKWDFLCLEQFGVDNRFDLGANIGLVLTDGTQTFNNNIHAGRFTQKPIGVISEDMTDDGGGGDTAYHNDLCFFVDSSRFVDQR